ncbi:unnamed protein product [Euphydryas editha]|uniref:HTH CENPB-type domain-containing protein n=1 Tax=Euphydryas editha TaxID=104508 RepID=A0AAU9UPX6_EUPED|nr:unnamed protein product [Euphydryas editha]
MPRNCVRKTLRGPGPKLITLRQHLLSGKLKVPLGTQPIFTKEEEKKLIIHIKKLEKFGFAPERKAVKEMAYQLALKLDKKAAFSQALGKAGDVWFTGFLKRNPQLSQRKSEGIWG